MSKAFDSIMRGLQEVKGKDLVMCPNPHYGDGPADICSCCRGERWITKEHAMAWIRSQEAALRKHAEENDWEACKDLLDGYLPLSRLDMTRYEKLKWLTTASDALREVFPLIEDIKKELAGFQETSKKLRRNCP